MGAAVPAYESFFRAPEGRAVTTDAVDQVSSAAGAGAVGFVASHFQPPVF